MEIKEITDISELLKIIPIEVEIMKNEPDNFMPLRDRIVWLECELNHKPFVTQYEFKVVGFYEKEKMIGYFIAALTKAKIKYFNEIRVYRAWYNEKHKECPARFWDIINKWGKANKVYTIRIDSNNERLTKHFQRKYKFKAVSTSLERRL